MKKERLGLSYFISESPDQNGGGENRTLVLEKLPTGHYVRSS